MEKNRRWKCMKCHAVTQESELLRAPNPFDGETLTACPHCKYFIQTPVLVLVCDEPGCTDTANCGWPTADATDAWGGWRKTCGKHYLQYYVRRKR
jgi:hypothetical protein